MIDKRTNLGKMIDSDRVVYQCIKCDKKFIGSASTDIGICPFCKWAGQIVIIENLVVVKGA